MWSQLANMCVGLWLMAAPAVLGYEGAGAGNDHIVGPLAATFAIISLWEFMRAVRWVNLISGLWQLLASGVIHEELKGGLNGVACGLFLVLFSTRRGEFRRERFGGGWSALWESSSARPAGEEAPSLHNEPEVDRHE